MAVRIVAVITEAVGKFATYPIVVMFIIICSRHPALDKLDLTWPLVAIWVLIVAVLFRSMYGLRHDALGFRDDVIRKLYEQSLDGQYCVNSEDRKFHSERLTAYIVEINREDRGAFMPLIQSPLVQALAFGASSGVILLQQFLR